VSVFIVSLIFIISAGGIVFGRVCLFVCLFLVRSLRALLFREKYISDFYEVCHRRSLSLHCINFSEVKVTVQGHLKFKSFL